MLEIYIASDHAGFFLKSLIIDYLQEQKHSIVDLGPTTSESCDYPIYAKQVCEAIITTPEAFGILICGTGVGMSIAANRIKGIRAALCTSEFQARATRLHNNANVLCLGERIIGKGIALVIVDLFLNTPFEGGRHERRINLFNS